MKPGILQQLMLYRYRYWVAYGLLALVSLMAFVWRLGLMAPGLSDAGQAVVVVSTHWDWHQYKDGLQIVNLPFTLLQKASISFFDLSLFSIRLPTAMLGIASAILFLLLVRQWHKGHIAIVGTTLFVASSWVAPMARHATGEILTIFIWIFLLYTATQLIRLKEKSFLWSALFALGAAMALYIPYGVYALVTALVVLLVHPQIRARVSAFSGPQVALGAMLFVPLLAPLAWGLYNDPAQAWALTGLSSHVPSATDFGRNIWTAIAAVGWRAPAYPELRLATLPLLDVGTLALLLAGLYRCARDWRSIRCQFLLVSIIVALLIEGLHPTRQYILLALPVYLIVTAGVTVLFKHWYHLFPRNPYARTFGLIPIVLFLSFILSYHYQRYFIAWAHTPSTYTAYNDDLDLVREQLNKQPNMTLITTPGDAPFYQLLTKKHPGFAVVTTQPPYDPARAFLVRDGQPGPSLPVQPLSSPVTNDDSQYALRFWLIKPQK